MYIYRHLYIYLIRRLHWEKFQKKNYRPTLIFLFSSLFSWNKQTKRRDWYHESPLHSYTFFSYHSSRFCIFFWKEKYPIDIIHHHVKCIHIFLDPRWITTLSQKLNLPKNNKHNNHYQLLSNCRALFLRTNETKLSKTLFFFFAFSLSLSRSFSFLTFNCVIIRIRINNRS